MSGSPTTGRAVTTPVPFDKSSKLAAVLEPLAQAPGPATFDYDALPAQIKALSKARLLRIDDKGRLLVEVTSTAVSDGLIADLKARGATIQRIVPERKLVQAEVDASRLDEIASLPEVEQVRPPVYPRASIGAVTSEGLSILNADDAQAQFGVDGSGVRVGVISDGIAGLAQAQASGDLGAVNYTTCNVVPPNAALKSRPDLGPGVTESRDPTWAYAGAEGTAMLEIVHDIAPGAELWYGYFGSYLTNYGTIEGLMAAASCLAGKVDIVVDDLGAYATGPNNGTSPLALNATLVLNYPANPIRGFYKAVGNDALTHFEGTFADSGTDFTGSMFGPPVPPSDFWDLHRFSGAPNTSDAGLGLPCGCGDTFQLGPNGIALIITQWNDPFGASANDYDTFIRNRSNGVFVGGSLGEQNGNDDPVEYAAYFNATAGTQTLDFYIGDYNGAAAPRTFEVWLLCLGCNLLPNGTGHNYNTAPGSVSNGPDAGGGVVTMGAVPPSNPATIQPYSSLGPTDDLRIKPDAVATDDVVITGAGGFGSPFPGTSAAAPHAAGIAALLIECNGRLHAGDDNDDPATERNLLRSYLLNNAVDLGNPGIDNTFGAGRLDALASANAMDCNDPDNDGARNGHEAWAGSNPAVADTDGDGCLDGRELGPQPNWGGQRSPLSAFDFFDVPLPAGPPGTGTRDRIISIGDISGVVSKFGTVNGNPPVGGQAYNADFDRTPAGGDPWDTGPGDGRVTIQDISLIVSQFGHSCAVL